MTAKDTHRTRLQHWPRLATFPTGAAVIAAAIGLDYVTCLAWILDKTIPDGWLLFLAGLHGIATTHFGIKRKTDFRNGTNGQADGHVR